MCNVKNLFAQMTEMDYFFLKDRVILDLNHFLF